MEFAWDIPNVIFEWFKHSNKKVQIRKGGSNEKSKNQ